VIFTEPRFLVFFLVVLGVYWALRSNGPRKLWLLLVSCVFYCAWDWRFLGLLLFSAGLDYFVALGFGRTRTPQGRRALLALSLTLNLGFLCFFKYYNFFVESGARLLTWLGLPASAPTLAIVLPIGISFYTFHTLSYTIDVYRGTFQPIRRLTDFSCSSRSSRRWSPGRSCARRSSCRSSRRSARSRASTCARAWRCSSSDS
jgi:alginate O-acetyltransferase complex protein AlgI